MSLRLGSPVYELVKLPTLDDVFDKPKCETRKKAPAKARRVLQVFVARLNKIPEIGRP